MQEVDETDPKGVREYGHFQTHHTYCQVASMRGVFPLTFPMEYGFQLLIFFMATGLDFNRGGGMVPLLHWASVSSTERVEGADSVCF